MQHRLFRLFTNLSGIFFCFILAACGTHTDSPTYSPIKNSTIVTMLVDGNPSAGFSGIASHIDTKVPLSGITMFPDDVVLSTDAITYINKNINSWLSASPVFDGTSPPLGVTVDSAQKKISVSSGNVILTWSFAADGVTRQRSDSTNSRTSSYTYTFTPSGQTNVTFTEILKQGTSTGTYQGTATYLRDSSTGASSKIINAVFNQNSTEVSTDGNSIYTVNGKVTMGAEDVVPGNLSFNGSISATLPPYGQVNANVTSSNMTYQKGSSATQNFNMVDATAITFTSTSDYGTVTPTAYPTWLQGIWKGTFTDVPDQSGTFVFSANSTTTTWFGQSADKTRSYGTSVKYTNDSYISFINDASVWGVAAKINDTKIAGTWSLNGRSGTFELVKQ